MTENTTQNIFRFLQLRGAITDSDTGVLELNHETPLARRLIAAEPNEKKAIAQEFLVKSNTSEIDESGFVRRIVLRVRETLTKNGNVGDLGEATNEQEFRRIRDIASDLLLASKLAGTSDVYTEAENLFRVTTALLSPNTKLNKLSKYYTRAISLPKGLTMPVTGQKFQVRKEVSKQGPHSIKGLDVSAEEIEYTIKEILSLNRPDLLRLPSEKTEVKPESFFSLNDDGIKLLSIEAKSVLNTLRLDPGKFPLDQTVRLLELGIDRAIGRSRHFNMPHAGPSEDEEERPYIKDVGVADLLVVKQHLKQYERVDIAHVENVLMGEKKNRTHRALERTEEIFTTEREVTQEKKTELETAERFELNRETAETVKRDQQFGFGLSLSGKYGPTVEFSSNLTASSTSSTEDSMKSATRYGKDIMERSLERVVDRVRTEQVRKLLREQEETNLHELVNETGFNISGVYQFLEKVYESQVFNYGIRQMFDFMVPEPASYIWYLEKTEKNLNLPPPPPSLDKEVPQADSIDRSNYLKYAAMFGVTGAEAPPPFFVTNSVTINGPGGSEDGTPHSLMEKEIPIPTGYAPWRAKVRTSALTDENLSIMIGAGNTRQLWQPTTYTTVDTDTDPDHKIADETLTLWLPPYLVGYDSQGKFTMNVLAYETNNYTIAADLTFYLLQEAYLAWQIRSYDKLRSAYLDTLQKYEAKVAELKAKAEAEAKNETTRFGAPPSQNVRTVKSELKKHCISIVTRQRYEAFSTIQEGDPPFFDFSEAAEQGTYTRFFEQAFEWDQMQYVFYPYFWARYKEAWAPMFTRSEPDPAFLEFLQAGSARVVVPVRPGFELALTHYLECGEIWNGTGEPPDINDPLYVPIITEIQERTGASQGEFPVGDPWETRVPTPLIVLRAKEEKLPRWERVDPSNWEWEEV
jgi:hypothetical protein